MWVGVMSEPIESDPCEQSAWEQCERATVGALLLGGVAVQTDITAVVERSDFACPRCGWVVSVVRRMLEDRLPVDMVSFAAHVESKGLLNDGQRMLRLRSWLYDVTRDVPAAVHGPWYAGQVVESAARRRVAAAGRRLVECGVGELDEMRLVVELEAKEAIAAIDRALLRESV